MPFIQRLGLRGLLSFSPDMEPIPLQPLNVLIGPNGSGKTNLIEALELLRAAPTDFAAAIRAGGGVDEWLWKGEKSEKTAIIDVETALAVLLMGRPLRYGIAFTSSNSRIQIVDEFIKENFPRPGRHAPYTYYSMNNGDPTIAKWDRKADVPSSYHSLSRSSLDFDQSILRQRRDPDNYPALGFLGDEFSRIRTFRDWTFGAQSPVRAPPRADGPSDELLPDARNLALVLNEIRRRGDPRFDMAMKRFLPRYERASTCIVDAYVPLYLHERGLAAPVSAARVSDGTLRFIAMLVALFAPTPPSLLCLEEPELGLHPDAVSALAEILVEASSRTQLVVTTHSEALLSELNDKVESVLVCENHGYGTTVSRLDPERLALWLKDYTLGDIWQIGEIGGNP